MIGKVFYLANKFTEKMSRLQRAVQRLLSPTVQVEEIFFSWTDNTYVFDISVLRIKLYMMSHNILGINS
jgi:hypothetical protein